MVAIQKGKKTDRLLLKSIFILTTLAWFVYPTGDIATLTLIKIPALIVTACLIIRNYRYANPKFRFPIFILALISIFGLVDIYNKIDLELIVGLSYFILFTFLIIISDTVHFDKSIKRFIYVNALISIAISTYYAYSPIAHWNGKVYLDYLTLGLYNSNFAGIILFAIGATFIVTSSKKRWIYRLLNYAIYGWNCYLIFETNCRSALVAALIIPLASIFLLKFRIKKWLIIATLVLPVLFVPFYMSIADNNDVAEEEVMGKGVVSGRQNVYHEYFDNLNYKEFFLGKFGGSGVPNQHNAPLGIITAFGVFGFIAFGIILAKKILQDSKHAKSNDAKIGLFTILACVIEGCGEVALFSGNFPIFVYMYIFFALAGSDNKSIMIERSK